MKLLTILVAGVFTAVNGCSIEGEIQSMSMEEKMYKAPVVLSATYESIENFTVASGDDVENAVLSVHCVFKSPETINGPTVRIFQYQPKNSCSGTTIEVGTKYVFTLLKSRQRNETDMYEFYEGVALASAAYEITNSSTIENDIVNVCGLDQFKLPASGCAAGAACCPDIQNIDPEVCVKSASVKKFSLLSVVSLFIFSFIVQNL